MLWTIIKKQMLISILSYRFVVGFVVCQILFVLATTILVRDYADRVEQYGLSVNQSSQAIQEVKVYSQLAPSVFKPPAQLSPICSGFDKRFGNEAAISYVQIPEIEPGRQEKNSLLAVLPSLDLTTVIQLVLGLLVLLLAHDTVSGEREAGTLALSLAGSVPRHTFLLGQYLGGMATVASVFAVGLILSVLLLSLSPVVILGPSEWLRLGLIGVVSLFYLSALFLLGMVTSILSRRSATSLVLLLFFWIVFLVIVPNGTADLATRLDPVPARGVVTQEAAAIRREFWSGIYRDSQTQLAKPERKFEYMKGWSVFSGDLPYPRLFYYAPREVIEWELAGLQRYLPLEMEQAEKTHEVYRVYERQLEGQARLGRALARLSPAWSYYSAISALAGTGAGSYLRFLEEARVYRRRLIEYVSAKDGLLSYRYFTRWPPDHFKTTAELDGLKTQPQRLDAEIGPGWDAVPALDLRDLPAFNPPHESLAATITESAPDWLLLVFWNLLLFLIAHVSFLRADARVKA